MVNLVVEAGRRFIGETKRANAAAVLLGQRKEQFSHFPENVQRVVAQAASRGSAKFLIEEHTPEQTVAAEKAARLMVDGGFVAVPVLQNQQGLTGGYRVHDASILMLTPQAQMLQKEIPQKVHLYASFSKDGESDVTTFDAKQKLKKVGIKEEDLPNSPHLIRVYSKTTPGAGWGVQFDYQIYYIPPNAYKEILELKDRSLTFRQATDNDASVVIAAIYAATGRELDCRKIGAIQEHYRDVPLITASFPATAYYIQRKARDVAESSNRLEEKRVNGLLEKENQKAEAALDSLFIDMVAIGKRVFFPQRRK